jgi:hypothetical protein
VGKHYLMVVLAAGQNEVRREYLELQDPEESAASALERWARAHPDMFLDGRPRQKNIDRTLSRLMAEPLYVQLTHPSSWWREQYESGAIERPGKKSRRRARS